METKIYSGLTYLISFIITFLFEQVRAKAAKKKNQNHIIKSAVECWTTTARNNLPEEQLQFSISKEVTTGVLRYTPCAGNPVGLIYRLWKRFSQTKVTPEHSCEDSKNIKPPLLPSSRVVSCSLAGNSSNSLPPSPPHPPPASACAGVRQLHSIWKPRSGKRKHNTFLYGQRHYWIGVNQMDKLVKPAAELWTRFIYRCFHLWKTTFAMRLCCPRPLTMHTFEAYRLYCFIYIAGRIYWYRRLHPFSFSFRPAALFFLFFFRNADPPAPSGRWAFLARSPPSVREHVLQRATKKPQRACVVLSHHPGLHSRYSFTTL